jgi:tetratricopeptide (TPR) repeat protein
MTKAGGPVKAGRRQAAAAKEAAGATQSFFIVPLVCACTVAAFSGALSDAKSFVNYDDDANFVENTCISSFSPENLRCVLTTQTMSVYEPIASLVKMLISVNVGHTAKTFAVSSILLHTANTVGAYSLSLQVYSIVTSLLSKKGASREPDNTTMWCFGASALFFGVHPLRVEAVCWLSCQPYLVAGLFSLACLHAHLMHCNTVLQATSNSNGAVLSFSVWKLLAVGFFAMAAFSKAAAISSGLAAIWFDCLCAHLRSGPQPNPMLSTVQRVLSTILDNSLIIVVCVAAVLCAQGASQGEQVEIGGGGADLDLTGRVLRAAYMPIFYIWKTVWPSALSVRYMLPETVSVRDVTFLCPLVMLVLLSVLALFNVLTKQASTAVTHSVAFFASYGWGFYIALLLPTLGLSTGHIAMLAADRYCYLPAMILGVPALGFILAHGVRNVGLYQMQIWAVIVIGYGAVMVGINAENWTDSNALWRHVLYVNPQDTLAMNNLATVLYAEKRDAEAWGLLNKVLELSPSSWKTHENVAKLHVKEGDYEKGLASFREAQAIKPSSYTVTTGMGGALRALGKPRDALVLLQHAVELREEQASRKGIDRSIATTYTQISLAMRTTSRLDEAVHYHGLAIGSDPASVEALTEYAITLRQGDKIHLAIEALENAYAVAPQDADTALNLANFLTEGKRAEEAMHIQQQAMSRASDNGDGAAGDREKSYISMGDTLRETQRFDEAVHYYKLAMQENPQSAEAMSNIGLVLKAANQLEQAQTIQLKAIGIDPTYAKAYINLGVLLAGQRDLDEAEHYLKQAVVLSPERVLAHQNLGSALHMNGKSREAIATYEKAVAINPKDARVLSNLALSYMDDGGHDKAVEMCRLALEIDSKKAHPICQQWA